jgi:hypothetical protein
MRTRLNITFILALSVCLLNQKVYYRGQHILPLDTALSKMHLDHSLSIDVSNTNFNDNLPLY